MVPGISGSEKCGNGVPMDFYRLFQSEDIDVVYVPCSSREIAAVTFTPVVHRLDIATAKRERILPGFGTAFFTNRGISSVCFISSRPHWWQTDAMARAINSALPVLSEYKRVLTYGASMGGYAALAFSRALGATDILSMSPQASINPKRIPFDKRWLKYSGNLNFDHDDINDGIADAANICLVYDSASIDRHHIDLINVPPACHFAIPFVGHSTINYLRSVGLLTRVIMDFLSENNSLAECRRLALAQRRDAQHFWAGLALADLRRNRAARAAQWLRRAIAINPQHRANVFLLARALEKAGKIEEAAKHYALHSSMKPGVAVGDEELEGL